MVVMVVMVELSGGGIAAEGAMVVIVETFRGLRGVTTVEG